MRTKQGIALLDLLAGLPLRDYDLVVGSETTLLLQETIAYSAAWLRRRQHALCRSSLDTENTEYFPVLQVKVLLKVAKGRRI